MVTLEGTSSNGPFIRTVWTVRAFAPSIARRKVMVAVGRKSYRSSDVESVELKEPTGVFSRNIYTVTVDSLR